MNITLKKIEIREVLHFLGWRGSPVEHGLIIRLKELADQVTENITPRVSLRRFSIEHDGAFAGTSFCPRGSDIKAVLKPCHEACLLAVTLGAQSERLLLREQAKGAAGAVLMDAVLSAAVEAVCDQIENEQREELEACGLHLTDRFSPGYGDMPLEQTKEICEILNASRSIGLTVSSSGIMIPRKSVTAVMGISRSPVIRRPSGCEGCTARDTCALARMKSE